MRGAVAAIASIGLCGAVLEPVVRAPDEPDSDSFPLSTYPMFAAPRPPALTMAWARGVAPGDWRRLAPAHVGTGEVMQAFATLQRAASGGPDEQAALCRAIAARVAGDAAPGDGLADVFAIELVVGSYDAVRWLAGEAAAGAASEAVLARCDVPGRGTPADRSGR
ncbi:MAG TPA: hypothetical protein VHW23_19580 [Kofleriaceae bacterium]|jgi:hypothetical protein|nr:hypothetical protein [Kofleriaceae bacterium]